MKTADTNQRARFLIVLALSALVGLAGLTGLSGPAEAQTNPDAQTDPADQSQPVELEPLGSDNSVLLFAVEVLILPAEVESGEARSALRGPGPVPDIQLFKSTTGASTTSRVGMRYTVSAKEKFRYLHAQFIVGKSIARTELNGIELWDDNLVGRRGTFPLTTATGEVRGEVDVRVTPLRPGTTSKGSCSTDDGVLTWADLAPADRLEIWYDYQPYVRGIDPAAGRFALPIENYRFKLNRAAPIELVRVINVDGVEQRFARLCGRSAVLLNSPFGQCQVDVVTGRVEVLSVSRAPVSLYTRSGSLGAVLANLDAGGSGPPPGVERSDADEFPNSFTVDLTDQLRDEMLERRVADFWQQGPGVKIAGLHHPCQLRNMSDYTAAAEEAALHALSPDHGLDVAATALADPEQGMHLLQLLRREAASGRTRPNVASRARLALGHADLLTLNVRGDSWRSPTISRLEAQRVGDRWLLTTRGLCWAMRPNLGSAHSVFDRDWEEGDPCAGLANTELGDNLSPALCRELQLLVGACADHVDITERPLLHATTMMLTGRPHRIQRHLNRRDARVRTILVKRRDWNRWAVTEVERTSGRTGKVTLTCGSRCGTHELDLIWNYGSWRFTTYSMIKSGFVPAPPKQTGDKS